MLYMTSQRWWAVATVIAVVALWATRRSYIAFVRAYWPMRAKRMIWRDMVSLSITTLVAAWAVWSAFQPILRLAHRH